MDRTGVGAAVRLALVVAALGVARGAAAQEPVVADAPAEPARVLTIEEAVATSLERNAALEDALWQLEAAQAQAREAWGSVMPTVNANASFTRNIDIATNYLPAIIFDPDAEEGELIGVKFGSDNQWFAQARADQPLFDAAAFLGVGAAGRFEELQQEMVRGQAQQVATDARLRYYDVLLAQEQLRLTGESVKRVEQTLDETRKLNQAGLSSAYDVLRLEVELSNLQPNLARAENATESARRALAVSMGQESLAGQELEGSLLTVELPPLPGGAPLAVAGGPTTDLMLERGVATETLPAPEALDLAMDRRSDLRQLRLTRDLRETERKVEISQYLPQVSLFATWTVAGQDNQGLGELVFFGRQRYDARAMGLEVSIPILSGFHRPARVSRLGAVVAQVDAQLDLATDQAENQVQTLLDQTRESYDRAAAQGRAVGQATRGYDIARQEYRAGIGSQLQVTDAELALRQSEFNYAQAVYDYLTAQAQLDAAVGVVPMVDEGDTVAYQAQR
ncbi:MAG: TolC family protein [Gemmatimonadota bacterium]